MATPEAPPAGPADGPEPPPVAAPAPEPAPVAVAAPEPAEQRSAAPASPPATSAPAPAAAPWEGLPYLEELPSAFRGSVPQVTVDVHVFTDNPEQRFVLVNLRRFREGERLPSGLRLEHITPDGVALEWQGRRFRLTSR